MVNFRDIYDSIISFASRFVKNLSQLKVFIPQRQEHGDISTNLAIIMAKEAKESAVSSAVETIKSGDGDLQPKQQEFSPKYFFDSISNDLTKLEYVEKIDFLAGFCNLSMS